MSRQDTVYFQKFKLVLLLKVHFEIFKNQVREGGDFYYGLL